MTRLGLSKRDLVPILCATTVLAGIGLALVTGLIALPLPPLSMATMLP